MINKISFIIPTKDGGEDFADLVKSIQSGILYALKKDRSLQFDTNFIINGNPEKPLKYLKEIDSRQKNIQWLICPDKGKVNAIHYGLERIRASVYILLDDDVTFDSEIIHKTITELQNDKG